MQAAHTSPSLHRPRRPKPPRYRPVAAAALATVAAVVGLSLASCEGAPATKDPCAQVSCGRGYCEPVATGIRCVCEETWGGLACERCAAGYHDDGAGGCAPDERCQPDSCGPGGLCDDAGGRVTCQCDAGFAGDRCDRCAAGYHVQDGWCAPDEHCDAATAPCGAHGTCDDADGVVRCLCDEGWAGPACDACAAGWHADSSGECVPDERCFNDTCSGFGRCEVVAGVARCQCAPHHTGPRCDFCDVGYHHDAAGRCVPDTYCSDHPAMCGFHGRCVDGGGEARCVCDVGWGGPTCARCAAGWHALESAACVPDERCRPTSCAGHGECVDGDGGVSCTCDPGYAGPHCEACAADATRDPDTGECRLLPPCPAEGCGPHGACVGGTCVCDPGYAGEGCVACALGYALQDGACRPETRCAPEVCSGAAAGACDDATGVALCTCGAAYAGPNCERCAYGYHREGGACVADEACLPDTCAAGGVCYVEVGRARCACLPPAAGPRCEACVEGYHLADAEGGDAACVPDEVCSPSVCDHGDCAVVAGRVECHCHPGWAGTRCKACAVGYHYDVEADTCAPDVFCADDGSSCSGHGLCIQGDGVITCSCDPGYAGEACEGCAEGYAPDEAGACVAIAPPE